LPAGLTANTNRSDSYFDGDEFDELHERNEKYRDRTLYPLLDIEHLPTREVISLCQTFLAMDRSDLESELAALKAELAKCRGDI
jgi:hypothetical protein